MVERLRNELDTKLWKTSMALEKRNQPWDRIIKQLNEFI